MSEQSFPSFDSALLVCDAQGCYLPVTADQIIQVARNVVDQRLSRGAEFTSPMVVKEYLTAKLAGFDVEVFAVLFLESQHRLIEYVEMFQGTLNQALVYPREVAKAALNRRAAAVIVAHNHSSGNPEPSVADKALTRASQEGVGTARCQHVGSCCCGRVEGGVVCCRVRAPALFCGARVMGLRT